jgi:type I restriction enzyme S subunit
MGELKPYPEYKDSGVDWLGKIPSHWEVVLNQRIFKEIIRPHNGKTEIQLSLSQKDGLIATDDMQERSLQTSTYDNWKVTLPGDLVINRFKAHLGVFFASTLRGIVSFHYGVFTPRRKLNVKYFELLYHTEIYRTIYAGRSNGMTVGLQNLSNQSFYNVRSIVPPLDEQEKIVSFLLQENKKIDEYIHARRRLIELLNERQQVIISRVVTRGLDPNVRLKPSGIELLGDIPENWTLQKIRSITKPVSERNRPDLPLLSVVREKGIILRTTQTPDENKNYIPDDLSNYKVVRKNDLVINKMKAWQGSVGISDLEGIVSPAYFVYHISTEYSGKYLHYLLRTRKYIDFMARLSKGIRPGQWDLEPHAFKQIPIPKPSLSEQKAIAKDIEINVLSNIEQVNRIKNEINLIFEYRTRLVSDIVTGKVDIRWEKIVDIKEPSPNENEMVLLDDESISSEEDD